MAGYGTANSMKSILLPVLLFFPGARNVNITESFQTPVGYGTYDNPWDWFHINSVQALCDCGGYFVNGRNVWTTYKVSETGDIHWRFQGSDGGGFTLPEGINFVSLLSVIYILHQSANHSRDGNTTCAEIMKTQPL